MKKYFISQIIGYLMKKGEERRYHQKEYDIVKRHIVGGIDRTLISSDLSPGLRGPVGNRRLSAA